MHLSSFYQSADLSCIVYLVGSLSMDVSSLQRIQHGKKKPAQSVKYGWTAQTLKFHSPDQLRMQLPGPEGAKHNSAIQ